MKAEGIPRKIVYNQARSHTTLFRTHPAHTLTLFFAMETLGYNSGDLLVEHSVNSLLPNDSCNNEQALLHSGIWKDLASKFCFFENSGCKHWMNHCPCEQCGIRRIEVAAKAPISPKPVSVKDEMLNVDYDVHGLRDNELPVKGTYIDPRIIPGFKYSVRLLGRTTEKVFPDPRKLLAIGQGYGKRLTFDAGSGGADHFWSDSCPDGFGLSFVALEVDQQFAVYDEFDRQIGRIRVTWVAPEVVEETTLIKDAEINAQVGVAFKATVSLDCRCELGCHEYEDIPMSGLARLKKVGKYAAELTKVDSVNLPGFDRLHLLPISDAIAQEQRRKNRCV